MVRKLKPLFVLSNLQGGGAERMVLGLLQHLDRTYVEPTLLLLRNTGILLDCVPADVRVICIAPKPTQLRHQIGPIVRALSRSARDYDALIGGLEMEATYLACLGGLLSGKPVLGWVHIDLEHHLKVVPGAQIHAQATRWLYPRLARVIFPTQGTARALKNLTALKDRQVAVIPNFLDLAQLAGQTDEGLPDWVSRWMEQPFVLAVGRLEYQKGFDLLIKAHARLKERGSSHRLLILGEGRLRGELQALATELGVGDSVYLPGWVSNPFAYMRRAQVFALSSRYEAWSLVTTEAMAAGIPVVACDCPSGPADVLDHGRCGLLVPPEDFEALAAAIGRLLSEPDLRATLNARGKERALSFGVSRVALSWEQLLRQVIA